MAHTSSWTIIGAGAAGILAVGRLLDNNIPANKITWIDPSFTVGDLGEKWFNVSSNTKVLLFTKFLESTKSFNYARCPFQLSHLDETSTCSLSEAVKPLQWISDELKKKVNALLDFATAIHREKDQWHIACKENQVISDNVILALGANPNEMPKEERLSEVLPMEIALNPNLLATHISEEDTVAVYGASHSAVLVIKNLLDAGCRVINFYKHPLKYAIYKEDHIIYDNTGLKGLAANYAKSELENVSNPRLTRCHIDAENADHLLAKANKAAYAIGFQARKIHIEGICSTEYNTSTGKIATNLYGLGIAYPEFVIDRYGNEEYSVGLFKFAKYLDRVFPLWLS